MKIVYVRSYFPGFKTLYDYLDCIGIFILFMRASGWYGLFPSWEGLGVGSFPRSPFSRGQVL